MPNSKLLLDAIATRIQILYGKQEARSMAFWLLESVTGWGKAQLLSGREMSEKTVSALEEKIGRLLRHEPLQYVIGEAFFYGYPFRVSPAVLIPRPETEELVQWVLQEMKEQAPKKVLDVGTGSGCIATALALENPHFSLHAIDTSPEALKMAESNAKTLGAKVAFHRRDVLQEGFSDMGKFDAVVSNPPYVTPREKEQMMPHVLDHEPEKALFVPQGDPLLFYRSIADEARKTLTPNGRIFFEVNQHYGEKTAELLKSMGYGAVALRRDLNGNWRMLKAVWSP